MSFEGSLDGFSEKRETKVSLLSRLFRLLNLFFGSGRKNAPTWSTAATLASELERLKVADVAANLDIC